MTAGEPAVPPAPAPAAASPAAPRVPAADVPPLPAATSPPAPAVVPKAPALVPPLPDIDAPVPDVALPVPLVARVPPVPPVPLVSLLLPPEGGPFPLPLRPALAPTAPLAAFAPLPLRIRQRLVQPSSSVRLPSSHSSPRLTRASPQRATVQRAVHWSRFEVFPSSHSSAGSLTPFPQPGGGSTLQRESHPSRSRSLPSSHSSRPALIPSPQEFATHASNKQCMLRPTPRHGVPSLAPSQPATNSRPASTCGVIVAAFAVVAGR
jgi:hypothetical protein